MHLGAANDGTTRDSYRSDKANLHLCSHTIGGSISSARMLCRRSSSKIAAGFVRAYMRKVPDKKHKQLHSAITRPKPASSAAPGQ
jgi:hypothetical protein